MTIPYQGWRILAVALGATLSSSVHATPAILQQFTQVAKPPTGSALAQAQCTTCHVQPPKLNSFGQDIKAELTKEKSQTFTAAMWQAVAPLDSDKDGFSNQAEVQAGTLPGDLNSKPSPAVRHETPAPPESFAAGVKAEVVKALHPTNAFHPIIVHFPIALFFVSLALDALGTLRRDPSLHIAGFYNLAIALISALASLVTGYIAFLRLHFPFEGNTKYHIILALCTTVFMAILYVIRVHRHEKMGPGARVLYLAVGLLGVFTLALVGHFGGTMVYGS